MNRIGFYKEDGVVMTELQEVTQVNTEECKAKLKVKEKPVYLQIFFHTPMDEHELWRLYKMIREHGIITMTDDEIRKNIHDDLATEQIGSFEFKSYDFKEAFECAMEICRSDIYWEGRMSVQISNEPTEAMKHWLDRKDEKKVNEIIENLKDVLNYTKYVDIKVGAEEKYGVNRETFAKAIKRMMDDGYFVTNIGVSTNPRLWGRILSKEPVKGLDLIPIRRKMLKEYVDRCEDGQSFSLVQYIDPQYDQIDKINKSQERELCSELLTNMILKGATGEEIRNIAKYSMVVMNTEKLGLNWIIARRDFEVDRLSEKYGSEMEESSVKNTLYNEGV